MRSWVLWVAALLNIVSAASAAAQPQAETGPPETAAVRLEFGWKPGMSARVETSRIRSRTTGGKTDSGSVAMRHRLRSEPHARGLLVTFSDPEILGTSGLTSGDGSGAIQGVVQLAASVFPNFVVDSTGSMGDLTNVPEMRAKLDSLVALILVPLDAALERPELKGVFSQPQFKEMLGNLASEATLRRAAQQEWNMLVGLWAGAEFEPGEAYSAEAEESIPMLNGAVIPMRYEFSLETRARCTGTTGPPTCVVLRMRSEPREESMRQALDDFMKRMSAGKSAGVVAFESLSIVNTVAVTVEPSTMRPYRLHVEKRITGGIRVEGSGVQQMSQVDERSTRFLWDD